MQKNNLANIIKFVFTKPGRLKELASKISHRLFDSKKEKARDLEWIRAKTTDFEQWALKIDPQLWKEANDFSQKMKSDAIAILKDIPIDLGGGGIYPVLYFLAVLKKPETIVETGVAAGFSSKAFLSALKKNGRGKLYSSDFPYFRIANPEKYIGILVDQDLRPNWSLRLEGDRVNLPQIMSEIEKIDIFHFDSDKSYQGRQFAFDQIKSKISRDSIIIFDDIQDNNQFRDFVEANNSEYKIFEFEGKYVGMIGA